jgi:hypothetical protein
MRKLIFLFSLQFVYLFSFGQIRLEGHIFAQEADGNAILPFANVVLKNADDSVKVEFSTISDMQGYYFFESLPMKQFWLEISYLGYQTIHKKIEIKFPEVGNSVEEDYFLPVDSKLLDEVVISANTVQRHIDKTTYLIKPEDIKTARFSMDLLEKIPSLSIDPETQKVIMRNGTVKILLNGVSANEMDLKAISPDKVIRLEYYDFPPARYAGYNAVVNIITRNMDDGFAVGTSLQHAFTTGFVNDDAFLKYNKAKHQFSLDYSLNYRDYNNVKTLVKYKYRIDDKMLSRTENSTNPFGYNNHFINLKYLNQLQDNYVFQVKFSPNLHFHHRQDDSEIEITDSESGRKGNKTEKSETFNPSLNLYFWKQLKNKQSITIDAVGNLFSSNQSVVNQEHNLINNHLELDDKMNLTNRKYSLISEAVYEKTTGTGKISIGNKLETYKINSRVDNSFDNNDYSSFYFNDYLYGEYTGGINRFTYRISAGLIYKQNNNASYQYSSWIFRPGILIGYQVNKNNSVRLHFAQITEEPNIAEQSDNVIFITDNILRKGNPYLKNSISQLYLLSYQFVNKRLDLDLNVVAARTQNGVNSYYVKMDDYYLLTSLNDKNMQSYGVFYSGALKPFGNNLLTVKLDGEISKSFVTNDITGHFSHLYTPLWYEIQLKIGKLAASYRGNIVGKDLSGVYLIKDENHSHFTLRYTQKNFSVWSSLLFAFTPAQYLTETIPASAVSYSSFRNIYDNKNMFTLGISYTFHSGKEYRNPEKLINNSDSDAGLFK